MKIAVYCDGGCWANPGQIAVGAVAVCEAGLAWKQARAVGHGTNNVAEYKAVQLGAEIAVLLGADEAHFFSDSQLIVNQIMKWWAITDPDLGILHGYTTSALMQIPRWSIGYVPREENAYADMLVNTVIRPDDKRADASRVTIPPYRENRTMREGWAVMARRALPGGVKPFLVSG